MSNRKWNRKNYFAKKKVSDKRKKNGHPVYVYGESNKKRKYLVFTHKPEKGKEYNFVKLKYNIDPNDNDDCYLKKSFEISDRTSLVKPNVKYRIHNSDKETVKMYKK